MIRTVPNGPCANRPEPTSLVSGRLVILIDEETYDALIGRRIDLVNGRLIATDDVVDEVTA